MNDAGRIGFVIKGEYNALATYEFLDVVSYGVSSYVAKKDTVGNTPGDDTEFWKILAKGIENIGHTIKDSNGTNLAQRSYLQFIGATATDDAANDATKIEVDDITIDSALSSTSENPVQNKVIKNALDGKIDALVDDTTGDKYKLGVNNGLLYIEDI